MGKQTTHRTTGHRAVGYVRRSTVAGLILP